ncbi:uncharacterized protein PAC_14554 [Phialocephala subalpina]|uniref:BTB domain-containing protein n=1 Tax=Phialocephala subalpina TaxID=576137 RepID=A0A1L7XI78_9HELO|nr:uncharacterized protein PAC_14554 [Phialocephala subalpina]
MEGASNNASTAAPASVREKKYDELFTLDGGNLEIVTACKAKKVIGKVVSQAMMLASPVWKTVLTSEPLPRQIDCSADNGEALLLLLRIAYLRFADNPKDLKLMGLLSLAILCEKYDCRDPVRPWSGYWIRSLKWRANDPICLVETRWLYIAWAFGKQEIFDASAMFPVKNVDLSVEGISATKPRSPSHSFALKLNTNTGSYKSRPAGLDRHPIPEKITSRIFQTRTDMIQQLLDIPYGYIERFDNENSRLCKLKSESCDAIIYGSLCLKLGPFGLWPKKTAEKYQPSLNRLAADISTVVASSLPNILRAEGQDHSGCMVPSFKDAVDKIMFSIPSPVLDCHRNHIEKRNKPAKSEEKVSDEAQGGGKDSLIVKLKMAPGAISTNSGNRPKFKLVGVHPKRIECLRDSGCLS